MGRLGWAVWVLAAAVACGPESGSSGAPSEVTAELPAGPARLVLRPGDCLLDLGPLARLTGAPPSSLPLALAALTSAPVLLRSPTLLSGAWAPVPRIPKAWAVLLERHGNPQMWRARSPLAVLPGSDSPRLRLDGKPAPRWSEESYERGQTLVWWDESSQVLMAVGDQPPGRVAMDAWIDPQGEFGDVERRLFLADHSLDGSSQRGRFVLDELLLDALLLPSPAVWELDIDELLAQRLELSVGLLDRAWMSTGDVLHRARQQSDGVLLAVEVVSGSGRVDRLWSHELEASRAGEAYRDATVDLSAYQGQAVTLRLLSEPGPGGSLDFDYAVWGGLRLRGFQQRTPARAHVVLIDIDTLRADRLGVYDGAAQTTPRLDEWAASEATVFTDAVSVASWTLPATVSMLTGLDVHQHGVERATGALGEGLPTLAQLLRQGGYETLGLASGGYLRPAFGLAQGFDRYRTAEPENLDFSEAVGWLADRDSERPFFLFLHTYAVHAPYPFDADQVDPDYDGLFLGQDVGYDNLMDPYREGRLALSPGDRAYVEALYDGLVSTMDSAIADLLAQLVEIVGDEPLLVIFTSDHGEAMFEHDVLGHGQEIYQELLAVPLMIAWPEGQEGARRREDPVSLVDIVPTVLDVVGLPIPAELAGRSLLQEQSRQRVRVARHYAEVEQRAVFSGGLKLIERWQQGSDEIIERELYDLTLDPQERRALEWSEDPRVGALQHRLQAYQAEHSAPAELEISTADMDGDARKQLQALGYLGDG